MVKDSPNRVIPSLVYFPSVESLESLVAHTAKVVSESPEFLNDMTILGLYRESHELPIFPNSTLKVYDGAALGQYLGGVDPKNLPGYTPHNLNLLYNNPSIGFVNETSVMKPDKYLHKKTSVLVDHLKVPLNTYIIRDPRDNQYSVIQNLHIHSKQLYQFSSVFGIHHKDIITGDRIVGLADFVILTREILQFHKGVQSFAKDIILVRDFNDININTLEKFFDDFCVANGKDTIKLFVYTHILLPFIKHILSVIDPKYKFILYLHNSDHPFDYTYKPLLESKSIQKVYAQNVTYPEYHNKIQLLPIGIANSMWPHGDLDALYTVMKKTYKQRKKKSVYVNINPGTYGYRKSVLNVIKQTDCYQICGSKGYMEYLEELAEHRFCLCLRGNGVDTHRFWESVYLGVIPIIINNSSTDCASFVMYLQQLDIPFYEIKTDNLDSLSTKYNSEYFNNERYNALGFTSSSGIYNCKALKVDYYK